MSRNKKWSAQAKLKIALEALKSETTIHDICQRYQVAPSQVHAWKKELLERGAEVFEKSNKASKKKGQTGNEHLQQQLYEKIGQLTVERDFLKKAWEQLHGNSDGV